ncbi:hypothetical protein EK904_011797, partial [Melospiza melodia maxima]
MRCMSWGFKNYKAGLLMQSMPMSGIRLGEESDSMLSEFLKEQKLDCNFLHETGQPWCLALEGISSDFQCEKSAKTRVICFIFWHLQRSGGKFKISVRRKGKLIRFKPGNNVYRGGLGHPDKLTEELSIIPALRLLIHVVYVPCLELNFLMCIGHSSRNKQQPLNPRVFPYKSLVLACKVSTSTELEKNHRHCPHCPKAEPLSLMGSHCLRQREALSEWVTNGSEFCCSPPPAKEMPCDGRQSQLSSDPVHFLLSEVFPPTPSHVFCSPVWFTGPCSLTQPPPDQHICSGGCNPLPCTRRPGLGGREGAAEVRVVGRKAK